jgi:hypothetical protein
MEKLKMIGTKHMRYAATAAVLLSSTLLGACGAQGPASPNPTSPQVRVDSPAQPAPPPAQATRPPMVRG